MIGVCVWDFACGFQSVNREVVGFELQLGEVPVKFFELDPSAGDLLQFGDHFEPNAIGKAVAGEM